MHTPKIQNTQNDPGFKEIFVRGVTNEIVILFSEGKDIRSGILSMECCWVIKGSVNKSIYGMFQPFEWPEIGRRFVKLQKEVVLEFSGLHREVFVAIWEIWWRRTLDTSLDLRIEFRLLGRRCRLR